MQWTGDFTQWLLWPIYGRSYQAGAFSRYISPKKRFSQRYHYCSAAAKLHGAVRLRSWTPGICKVATGSLRCSSCRNTDSLWSANSSGVLAASWPLVGTFCTRGRRILQNSAEYTLSVSVKSSLHLWWSADKPVKLRFCWADGHSRGLLLFNLIVHL